ncbi:MAG TPA: hypothetical protein VFC51_08105 [Chloroflexota bacterium]|nr:hypothetical protein [Chloroflexota bacterium]
MNRDWRADFCEALVATGLLGATVAVIYRLVMGEVPWSFFLGEILGLGMGVGLLTASLPRRWG